jgi:hypothetical protein
MTHFYLRSFFICHFTTLFANTTHGIELFATDMAFPRNYVFLYQHNAPSSNTSEILNVSKNGNNS